jgi:antitoxin ParD1/3/4
MSKIKQLTVALPAEELESVHAAIDAGEYASTGEIVREALRLWEKRRVLREQEVARLRTAYEEGLASGPAAPLDVDRVKREGRARLGAMKLQSGA